MKQLFRTTIAIMLLAFAITSCNKDGDPIIPDPDPGTGDHPELWSYDLGFGSMADVTPAIDDNDNIYFAMVKEDGATVVTIGLNKDGGELWRNEFAAASTTKATYSSGKVFVATESPTAIYCVDASNGNTLWEKNLEEDYDFTWIPMVAVNNNKVYVSTGQFWTSFLMALDFDGNEIWIQQGPVLGASFTLSVAGNALYFHDGEYLFRYDDMGSSCDSIWAYQYGSGKSTMGSRGYIDAMQLPIGDDGNIYLREENILIISPQGQLVKEIVLDDSYNGYASGMTLTSDNDILIGKGDLVKLSSNGSVVWESSINDGMLINPAFGSAPVISSNGDFYDAQLFGLYSVKSNGTLNWKENAETGAGIEYGNLHPPVLNHQGNIISVSSEQSKVRCFKGDGNGLATSGWPKVYGNYGNTSAR